MIALLSEVTIQLVILIVFFGFVLWMLEVTKKPVAAQTPGELYYDPVTIHRMEVERDASFMTGFDAATHQAQLQNLIQKVELLHVRLNTIEQRLEELPYRIQSTEYPSLTARHQKSERLNA